MAMKKTSISIILIGLICFAIGFVAKPVYKHFFGKHIFKSTVLAELEKPLPQFPNAPILKEFSENCGSTKETLRYKKTIVIDVSKLSYNQMNNIMEKYNRYFNNLGIGPFNTGGSRNVFHKMPDGFKMVGSSNGRYFGECYNKNFIILCDSEFVEFENKNGMFFACPVDALSNKPAKGQRVLNMYFSIFGFNLD